MPTATVSKTNQRSQEVSKKALPEPKITLKNVSVDFARISEEERSIKGRIFGSFRASNNQPFHALQDISVCLREKEVVGVVGTNGAGKSTLLRVMSGIIKPKSGTVEINGIVNPVIELGAAVNPELTGRENCFLYGSIMRLTREQTRTKLAAIQEFSELGDFFDQPVKSYSSGMAARLAFTLATEIRPDIVLLDEVLSVGDQHFQQKSFARMTEIIQTGNLIVIVSHSPAVLERMCTRLLWLDGSRLAADGAVGDVLSEYLRVRGA